jgi:hypothetical protein
MRGKFVVKRYNKKTESWQQRYEYKRISEIRKINRERNEIIGDGKFLIRGVGVIAWHEDKFVMITDN